MIDRTKLNKYLGYLLLIDLALVILAAMLGGELYQAPSGAFLISLPVWSSYLLVHVVSKIKGDFGVVVYFSAVGVYVVNLAIGYYFVFFYLPNIIESRSLGPAEGYWFLFTISFAFKFSIVGVVSGVLSAIGYLVYQKAG